MPHILIVCTANICRSPVGEVVLRTRLHRRGFTDWTVGSAGTWALVGHGAAEFSIEVMAAQGLDISAHRARMVSRSLLAEADLVLCMESGHMEALRAEFPDYAHHIFLLSQMVGRHYSISDPYGRSLSAYQRMATELTNIIDQGLEKIIELTQAKQAPKR